MWQTGQPPEYEAVVVMVPALSISQILITLLQVSGLFVLIVPLRKPVFFITFQ